MELKNQQKIDNLQVYCTFKERECGWSGRLQDLEVHLDPDQNECQYMDISCPLHYQQLVPRNAVQQHTSQECVKREHTCQHCNYKASYEEVMDVHLPDCQYVPLQCPNRCGVTCEREMMEDHLKICLLEEVACKFERVGCKERPRRENLEEHGHENMEKHLALTATTTASLKDEIDSKIDKNTHHEAEERLVQKIDDLEKKLIDKDQKIEEIEKKLSAIEEAIGNLTKNTQNDEIIHEIVFTIESFKVKFAINFKDGYQFIVKISFDYEESLDSNVSIEVIDIDFESDQLTRHTAAKFSYTFLNGFKEEIHNGTWEGKLHTESLKTPSKLKKTKQQ